MVLTGDLLVEQGLANTGTGDTETRDPVDRVDGQAETVGLVANGEFQRCVDVALSRCSRGRGCVLAGPAVGQTVDEPGVGVEVEDDRRVRREKRLELSVRQPVRVLVFGISLNRSTTLTNRTLMSGKCWRSSAVAASDSIVGMSPQLAMTTSGSVPWSLLAQSQMPTPFVQWSIASSMFRYCKVHLLVGDDDVDVVDAVEAMVGDRQQAVGVRRQVDAHHVGALVGDHVEEARVLVGEAVVVLSPDQRR